MSCLTQEERSGLEDIFLSMGARPSPFEKCKNIYSHYTSLLGKEKKFTTYTAPRKYLKSYVQIKLYLRSKREKLGNQLRFSRHK